MRFIARGKASDIVIMLYSMNKVFNKVNITGYETEINGWQDLDRLDKWHNKYSVYNVYVDNNILYLEEEYHHEKEFKTVVEVLM